jgi:hypothetical protein
MSSKETLPAVALSLALVWSTTTPRVNPNYGEGPREQQKKQFQREPPTTEAEPTPEGQSTPIAKRYFLPIILNPKEVQVYRWDIGVNGSYKFWWDRLVFQWRPGSPNDWFYDLNTRTAYPAPPEIVSDLNFIRGIWCDKTSPDKNIIGPADYDYEHGIIGRMWFIFNEWDDKGQCGSALSLEEKTPTGMAELFMKKVRIIKEHDPNAIIFLGGNLWLNNPETAKLWEDILNVLDQDTESEILIGGVHFHLYPGMSDNEVKYNYVTCSDDECRSRTIEVARKFVGDLQSHPCVAGKPVYVSETGQMGGTQEDAQRWMDMFYTSLDYIGVKGGIWFAEDGVPGFRESRLSSKQWLQDPLTDPSDLTPQGVQFNKMTPQAW